MPRETKTERQAREAQEHEERMARVQAEYPANLMATLERAATLNASVHSTGRFL
jgi:hypothetical protein